MWRIKYVGDEKIVRMLTEKKASLGHTKRITKRDTVFKADNSGIISFNQLPKMFGHL